MNINEYWDIGIPYHNSCGLPVELCICPDAEVKFIDGKFIYMADDQNNEYK